MRRAIWFIASLLVGFAAYAVINEAIHYAKPDIVALLFQPVMLGDLSLMLRPIDMLFVGGIMFGGGFLVKPKVSKSEPRGRGRPKRDPTPKITAKPKGHYEIEVIIVGEGINHHHTLRSETLMQDYQYENFTYNVTPKKLYQITRNFMQKIGDKIRGTKNRFCIVFEEKKPAAIGPEREEPESVTSELLGIVERSTVLRRAFSELFTKHIGGKKMFFILIVAAVAAFVYLYFAGYLDLDMLGF